MILVNRTTNGWPGFPESKHSLNVVSNQFLSSVFLNFFFVYNASKTTLPEIGSRITGSIPKKGTVADPGFVSIAPGKGVMTTDPISVCLIADHKDTNH